MNDKVALVIAISLWLSISDCKLLQPNIIVILIDDLDVALGGLEPMAITRRLVAQHGATFTNAFVSTPVCCPSRSSILTGKYVHNHRVINNTASGNCGSRQWQNGPERKTMATYLQANGYATFYGGKYLNQYGKNETGGVEHVPPGYDRWVGLVGNSRYYNYTLSVDGQPRDHGDDYHLDYLTDVLVFIATSALNHGSNNRPLFAVIAPPACHSPFTPAPQFARKFAGRRAPRWPSFNRHPGLDKHWLVRQAPQGPLPKEIIDQVDHIFRQRWRTLLSVDQMIGKIVKLLGWKGQLDRTWLVVTSDHGYHLGQFTLPVDKRLPYETDVRVPLLVIAPGNQTLNKNTNNNNNKDHTEIDSLAVVSIDLAPTVLDMAAVPVPRRSFLIEYHGEADLDDVDLQCQQDPNTTLCLKDFGCKCQDAANNTYVCLRTLPARQQQQTGKNSEEDSLYCQFDDSEKFVEYYDLRDDPYQLDNRAYRRSCNCTTADPRRRKLLARYAKCRGPFNCF
ncbi:hypothetical protein DAPPUDRAFT_50373 [Daphnia pulex]|uniref:Sulfatase N-terminal domain-containing protein n=1 Tax=Daphnia pulex TaxID=6669 RepID=E9GHF3_DAPPU|nr:hypothetical protein DAPPUDRAFT_50373 [Daphnia pulex]|eukprot:EFX81190.1 hypothetical protein DAPPUDRAFT_50373 [Daphnia pulex]